MQDVTTIAGQQYARQAVVCKYLNGRPLRPGNITIQARDVAITGARERSDSSTVSKQGSSGFTLAVSSPLISAAQTAMQMVDAAGQTKDARMQALVKSDGTPGVNLSLSFGSSSTSTNQSKSVAGSTVAADGNVGIVATGAGQNSNLLVQGSTIGAGDTVTLKADNAILLQAAQSTGSEHSSSQSQSGSIGVSFGTGGFNASVYCRLGTLLYRISILHTAEVSNFLLYVKPRQGHAVEGFSDALAFEGAPLGIKVTCIEPSPFRTDWAGRSLRQTPNLVDD